MAPTFGGGFGGQRKSKTGSKKGQGPNMGKRRKVSKGHSSGFVLDNHNAAETMDESEGFGCSEVLYAPKRKCINLNLDNYNGFRVPCRNLPLSNMSQSERTDLELRLRNELEQVKILQKRIASLSSDVVDLSPYSDIRSCSDGQKRPPLESSQRSMGGGSALQSKKRFPSGVNGPRTVGAAERQPEPVKQGVMPGTSTATLMKQCEVLLNRMMIHQYGWVFNTPVDVVKLKIPDYFKVIKHPMDFGTVKSKLLSGAYSRPLDFAADVRLTFSNALTYNPPGNDVYFMADTLRKYFEVRWKPIEKKIPVALEAPMPSRPTFNIEAETPNRISSPKKKLTPLDRNVKQEPVKRTMSEVEKHSLSTDLESLLAELPDTIIDFLRDHSMGASHTGEDEIEIDIGALNDDTLFKLRKLLDDFLLDKQKKQEKAEPCEMELHNESGLSNSSVQQCKVSDPVEDEVDIGGNDPPISSYPPIEIQKDAAHINSKCSSSSSSSSESGSSSSDSDSESSGSEHDGAKDSFPTRVTKDILNSGVTSERKTSDPGIPGATNDSLNGLSEVEQSSQQSRSAGAEADGRQDGEIAPSEREVSPNKLYRAALLRNRFADTILKAQEKTLLDKGKKQDPEKLRLEKEELERRRSEEKARLQAEAKAAEEARRKAEAEAAVELRKQRELEREAARQALQKMEKTVDINVDCQFLKDLEMLGSAGSDEQLENIVDEGSPEDRSENGMGSFKLNGSSNPLEQLGLYMKADDEEEEEGDDDPQNDPEEGEID